uniref:Uncharacterized protein n=1 Tax=Amphimedon queenslandica TaxID=400682 RepID=A0A1X7VJM6_AMPQE
MATDLRHLKSVRAGHKGAVSRKMTDLNALLVSTPVDRDSLERIKLALERKLDLLNKLSEDIAAALTNEGEIKAEIESAELVSDPTSTLRVKLPELSLRPFDGNFANWFTFWDTYKAAVHNNA